MLGRTKLPPLDVIETGIGIIFPMAVPAGVGVGVVDVGLGVGVFVFGARVLLADACMAFAAKSITTRTKARKVRKTFFVCIRYLIFQDGWVARSCRKRSKVWRSRFFDPPSFWIHLMLPDMEIAKNSTLSTYFCLLVLPPF